MQEEYAYGMWVVAAFNVGLFLFFMLSFLAPKGHVEWRNMGVVTAFLVALFAEMYGFPLTIFLLLAWLEDTYPVSLPFSHKFGHLWVVVFGGSTLAWAIVMGLSLVGILAGLNLLSKGWRLVHDAHGRLVTGSVYGYVRHPQYTGLFLIIAAFLIQWPTLLTVAMAPILFVAYVRLSRSEERTMLETFGEQYERYAAETPMFFPPLRQWKAFLTAPLPPRRSGAAA